MLKTYVQQLADTIRGEIEKGRWAGDMPGHKNLASELGANSRTMARALEQLEKEGLVQSQGPGRRRKIVPTKARLALSVRCKCLGAVPFENPLIITE